MGKKLPKVGDLITFSTKWSIVQSQCDKRQPVGVITKISSYKNLLKNDTLGEVYGTLAYPITIDIQMSDFSTVFIVQWFIEDPSVKSSYAWINEEWFFNESFIILSES